MFNVSSENKTIAKKIAAIFGGAPKVIRFWDDNHNSSIAVLISEEAPQKGVSSYATVCLSDSPLYKDGKDTSIRLELLGACQSSCKEFANIMSTAAFCIINSKWFCCPGMIFPDVVSMYNCSNTMHHLLFVPPFLWEDFKTLELNSKTIAWLMVVPISEEEYCFAESEGVNKLETLFEEEQIDIYNINRPSVV